MGDPRNPRDDSAESTDTPPTEEPTFRVEDRRHWADPADEDDSAHDRRGTSTRSPSIVDEHRERADAAEARLQEYIEAFKRFRAEQDEVRARLARDVDRKVEGRFGDLVSQLVETMDDLELALDHARQAPGAEGLVRGVELARKRFLDTLAAVGVERFGSPGVAFDPNEAEALRVDPVPTAAADGTVTEVLRPGYRLAGRVLRAARVAVGRHRPA
jgi:molecular chaperone GrpE